MAKLRTPAGLGLICPAMINEKYEYELSGDAGRNCTCAITDKRCTGVVVADPDDQSSQFFSRGKCMIDDDKLKDCPVYGSSKETFRNLIKDRADKELNEKLKNLQ